MTEEENTVDTPALGAGDISSEQLTYRTSYEVPRVDGDFIHLCDLAKKGDQKAVAALWPVLYQRAYDALKDAVKDDESLQEYSTEFADRTLLGWVNTDNPRGTGKPGPVPPLILRCDYNYQQFISGWLRLWVIKVREALEKDPFAAGVVDSVHEDDGEDEDFLASHEIGVGDMRDEYVPTPEDVMIAKDALDKFREWLPAHLQDIFDGARMGMKQEAIAYSVGITQGEVSRRLAELYALMPKFKRECL